MSQISKSVNLTNSEILVPAKGKIINFLLVQFVMKVVEDTVKCIQLDKRFMENLFDHHREQRGTIVAVHTIYQYRIANVHN